MLPNEASTQAVAMDTMFVFMLGLALFFLLIVAVPLIVFTIKYRRRPGHEKATQIEGSQKLEIFWTVVPVILAMGIFTWGAKLFLSEAQPPANAEQIFVLGKQWMWKFQHANGRQEISELHVPVDHPVRLTMISQDVIHSFFVPAFRLKQDVLPDRYSTLWFQPTQVGNFDGYCAEFCGTLHSGMLAGVVVMAQADYEQWLAAGPAEGGAAPGAALFQQLGCSTCHHPDNGGQGPPLIGLYGRPVRLQGGSAVTADENYLRESILNPEAKVVEGYQPVMPSFNGRVDADQMLQLIAYIKSLNSPSSATPRGSATP